MHQQKSWNLDNLAATRPPCLPGSVDIRRETGWRWLFVGAAAWRLRSWSGRSRSLPHPKSSPILQAAVMRTSDLYRRRDLACLSVVHCTSWTPRDSVRSGSSFVGCPGHNRQQTGNIPSSPEASLVPRRMHPQLTPDSSHIPLVPRPYLEPRMTACLGELVDNPAYRHRIVFVAKDPPLLDTWPTHSASSGGWGRPYPDAARPRAP